MTAISPLTAPAREALVPAPRALAEPGDAPGVPDATSTTLTLGQSGGEAAAYSLAQLSPTPVWERSARDAVSSRMAANVQGARLGNRFDGLGAALLERFRFDGNDFSQSVIRLPAGTPVDRVDDARFHAPADNEIALTVTTRGGATVAVTLGSDADRLSVRIAVTGGELSEDERTALAALSDGFQQAIDGLAKVPPRLDLAGVLRFDGEALSSVSLHATVQVGHDKRQTIDLVADDKRRSLTASGALGTIAMDVDVTGAAIVGNEAQRQAALTRYLHTFDQAQRRGQGDADLMALFKDGFGALHGNMPAVAATAQATRLGAGDQGMLTGLADFSASVTQTRRSENPLRSDEVDAFSYRVSQQTEVRGSGPLDRTIRQRQEATLDASFHRSLTPDTTLLLDASRYSQNYAYERIHDTASSDMTLAYEQGVLAKASLTQSASEWQRTQTYRFGKLEEDSTVPSSRSRTIDVLALVRAAEESDAFGRMDDDARRDRVLADMHDQVLLQTDPARLAR